MKVADLDPRNDDEKAFAEFMLSNDRFTHADLDRLGLNNRYKENFLSRLRNLGILRDLEREGAKAVYTVLTEDAAKDHDQKARNTPEGRIWSAMRVLKEFTPEDVSAVVAKGSTAIDLADIKKYCQSLFRAEYLIVTEKGRAGFHSARYRLVTNSGPLPPRVRRLRCMVDGNTGRVAYVEGARQ